MPQQVNFEGATFCLEPSIVFDLSRLPVQGPSLFFDFGDNVSNPQ